jgi:hypothetical protein
LGRIIEIEKKVIEKLKINPKYQRILETERKSLKYLEQADQQETEDEDYNDKD